MNWKNPEAPCNITEHDSAVQSRGYKSCETAYMVTTPCGLASKCQGRIKLFGAPRQWKYFRPLFQAVFLSGCGGITPPDWVKHHASQSQDRNNKYFILYSYIEFCINNKI